MSILETLPILISLTSFWLAYKAFVNSKETEALSSQYNALAIMAEWKSYLRKIKWEHLFISREIEEMLENYPDNPELKMWQAKIDSFKDLAVETDAHLDTKLSEYQSSPKNKYDSEKEASSFNRGKMQVQDALIECQYIKEALVLFNPEKLPQNPKTPLIFEILFNI